MPSTANESLPATAGGRWSRIAKILGFGFMIVVVLSQGSGLALSAALKNFQGSFSIVLVGTTIVTVVTVLKKGARACGFERVTFAAVTSPDVWREGVRSLRWSLFTRNEKVAIISLAVTSALINLGGPLAVRELGNGVNAAFSTAGALAAGALALRFFPQWLGRGIVLTAVVFAAVASGQGTLSILGLVAALCAATHMWNLPKRVVRLGDKSDEGLTVANLISAPFVLIGTWSWDHSQGISWEWGTKELIGALCAGLLVMVIPVFLQNAAGARGVKEQDMGALSSLASPLHATVGVILAPVTLALTGKEPVLPTNNQWGFFVIVALAALAVPFMPKDNSWKKAQSERDEANAKVVELTDTLRRVTETLREETAAREAAETQVGRVNTERESVVGLFNMANTRLAEVNAKCGRLQAELDALTREAEPPATGGDVVDWDADSGEAILMPNGGLKFIRNFGLTLRSGDTVIEAKALPEGSLIEGRFTGGLVAGGTISNGVETVRFPQGDVTPNPDGSYSIKKTQGESSLGASSVE